MVVQMVVHLVLQMVLQMVPRMVAHWEKSLVGYWVAPSAGQMADRLEQRSARPLVVRLEHLLENLMVALMDCRMADQLVLQSVHC